MYYEIELNALNIILSLIKLKYFNFKNLLKIRNLNNFFNNIFNFITLKNKKLTTIKKLINRNKILIKMEF